MLGCSLIVFLMEILWLECCGRLGNVETAVDMETQKVAWGVVDDMIKEKEKNASKR